VKVVFRGRTGRPQPRVADVVRRGPQRARSGGIRTTGVVRRCEVCDETRPCDLRHDPWQEAAYGRRVLKWYCRECYEAVR